MNLSLVKGTSFVHHKVANFEADKGISSRSGVFSLSEAEVLNGIVLRGHLRMGPCGEDTSLGAQMTPFKR